MQSIAMDNKYVLWLKNNRNVGLGLIGASVLIFGLLTGSILTAKGWMPFSSDENKVPIYLAAESRMSGQSVTLNSGFSAVAKAVTPAVVTIKTKVRASSARNSDPFFDLFKNLPDLDDDGATPRRRTPQSPEGRDRLMPRGIGSGVIVSPDGYILTNDHVVEDADKVEVELTDGRTLPAKIIGTDTPTDIAVIKIEASNLPTLTLGDSNKVEVGDVVLAVGNPLGVGQTVTMGIISAKGRSTRTSQNFEDFLQTDASINQGNSGGALVNLRAELIGVPSQILSRTGGNIGIGFAIPSMMAKNVMDQLIRSGKVTRGKLGISIGPVSADLAKQFNYSGTKGAFVQDVIQGDPAEKAGVKPGDIITELQGRRLDNEAQLRNTVSQTAPGSTVKFKVFRDGKEIELTAVLGELDIAASANREDGDSGTTASALEGVTVMNLSADVIQQLKLPVGTKGVVVSQIDPESAAASAGLRRGDVIQEINRQPISSTSEFNSVLQKSGKGTVLLRVRSSQGGRFVIIDPSE